MRLKKIERKVYLTIIHLLPGRNFEYKKYFFSNNCDKGKLIFESSVINTDLFSIYLMFHVKRVKSVESL